MKTPERFLPVLMDASVKYEAYFFYNQNSVVCVSDLNADFGRLSDKHACSYFVVGEGFDPENCRIYEKSKFIVISLWRGISRLPRSSPNEILARIPPCSSSLPRIKSLNDQIIIFLIAILENLRHTTTTAR